MREFLFLPLANNLPRLRIFDRIRYVVYQWAGLKIQGQCTIWGPLTIRPIGGAKNIKIGKGSFLNTEIRFGIPYDEVIIGESVKIGPRVMFETVSHGLRHIDGHGRGAKTKSIIIENEVWIGGGSIVTQGVTIGQGAVVAAGSVVNSSVEAYTVVGGVPAKFIRKVDDES